jgi:hypothetical protein
MRTMAPDEKASLVMIYTQDMLARGEIITKQNVRVNIWLRNQGVPNYIRLVNPQVLVFGGGTPKSIAYPEILIPTAQVIGYHLVPPAEEPMDYEATEVNRLAQPVSLLMGTFMLKGLIRISTQTDVASSLDVMHISWLSVYDAEIINPSLPQFSMKVPMLLVNPNQVSFGLG